MSIEVDVVVVGGGAAGLSAAYTARRLGASVALIERGRLGGDCTWTGCVPSKALLERARQVHTARLVGAEVDVDFPAILASVHDIIHKISREEDRPALEALGITVLEGQASFTGPRALSVDGTRVHGKAVILATGSRPLIPPIEGLADAGPLTNETVFSLEGLPDRLAVIGGGAVGLELGQAFSRLGSHVTVLEREPRLAPAEEPEVGEALTETLHGEGIEVLTGSPVGQMSSPTPEGTVRLRAGDGAVVEADAVLCTTGRQGVTDGLELERAGVDVDDRGFIKTDDRLRTTAKAIYAAGDVIGGLQFTHVGYDAGALAVRNALGRWARRFDTRAVPWAIYTDPEVGRVGLTEAQAHDRFGDRARVAYLPIADTDRAKVTGAVTGFVKLIAAPRPVLGDLGGGQLVGATIVCRSGGDVIHEAALAMRMRALTGRLAQTVHAYPSWSLAVREAAAQFFTTYKGRRARPARPH